MGYYRSGKRPRQDYLTSPEIHPVFGQTLGACLGQIAMLRGQGGLTILELGGGSGILAEQILSVIKDEQWRYIILEKGRRDEAGPITWVNDPEGIPAISGLTIVIANEFFDALPFHRIVSTEAGLKEAYIDFKEGYAEVLGELTPEVEVFLEQYPLSLNLHQSAEVTTRSLAILTGLTGKVEEALLLLFDYGYHISELALGRFFEGSSVGYKDMKLKQDLFEELGTTDITHHVNFDHLSAMLDRLDWVKVGEIEQYRFLINIGVLERIAALPEADRIAAKGVFNPQGIGSMISVLGFTRNITWEVPGFGRKPW